MNYETIKSFVLVVLVGTSFLLSFILWSYQPNYEDFYDKSYVNEVDVGGTERTKNDLVKPSEIIFRNGNEAMGFINPMDQQAFYKELASWPLYEYNIADSHGRPGKDEQFVEVVFPSAIPASLITNLFTFHDDQIDPPNWSFERVFITFDEQDRTLKLVILSVDDRKQISATIEKSDTYEKLLSYLNDHSDLEDYISFGVSNGPIYLPKESVELSCKTLVASSIEPDSFINALFSNPNLVTRNIKEAYFTDGQRGMRIVHEGRQLEFINPIQSTYDIVDPNELLDKSVNNINEHKGWTDDFLFENINNTSNNIRYRLYHEGYPVFDHYSLSIIEQEWREQELYQYTRPLIQIGNLLNTKEVELPSGQEVSTLLTNDRQINKKEIKDIQIGYSLNYMADAHSLTLEPSWYILYQGEWIKINPTDYYKDLHAKGGD